MLFLSGAYPDRVMKIGGIRMGKKQYDPCALKENTIICGNARFQFITSRIIRLEWDENGKFEDQATLAVVNRNFPKVDWKEEKFENRLTLTTEYMRLEYTNDGNGFSENNLTISFRVGEEKGVWNPGMADEKNLGGTIRTLDGVDGDKWEVRYVKNPDYIENERGKKAHGLPGQSVTEFLWEREPVDLGKGLLSQSGWSVIDDSKNILIDKETGWITERHDGKKQDLYFLGYGNDYKNALKDAAELFGRQPLPPRYAFGYWWSRYWAYTDKEIEGLIEHFDMMKVPIDVMVIDMDWHLEGWTGYTWDKRYFPDPKEFLAELKRRNMKVTLNLHPASGVKKHEEQFEAMAKAMELDKENISEVEFNITDPKYMEHYFTILHHPQEKNGVDFWWMDWQQGETTAMKGLDTLPWINHLHWKDMEDNKERGNKRPLIFSRFGGIGAGRYCIGFSGDTHSNWNSLAFQPYFTATASNVLYGYWSHDIGGHAPGEIEPELYTRWMQYGIYSPILRTHTTKNAKAERRVWEYPDPYNNIMIEAIRKRYELVPYIYTECRKTFDTGISLCRPMYYDYPDYKEAYRAKNQYMFGEKMLIAPVIEKVSSKNEMVEVAVWLPKGTWFDTALGSRVEGGKVVFRKYMIHEIPVFVKPGTVIPGQFDVQRLDDTSIKNILFTIYNGEKGECTLYEDDGISTDYEEENFAQIQMSHTTENGVKTIVIAPVKGNYDGFEAEKKLKIQFVGTTPPSYVKVAGNDIPYSFREIENTWRYDGDNAKVIISLGKRDFTQKLAISIGLGSHQALADGLKGIMSRMKRMNYYNTLATSCHIMHEKERLGVKIAQTGNRISRRPEMFERELKELKEDIKSMEEMLSALSTRKSHWESENDTGPGSARYSYCMKAIAILKEIQLD